EAMKTVWQCTAMAAALIAALSLSPGARAAQKSPGKGEYFAYVGTYTGQKSQGIYVFRFDVSSGKATAPELAAETPNPSFVAVHPNGRLLYAVSEIGNFEGQRSGAVSAFSIDRQTGKLTFLNKAATRGAGPCYLVVDKTGKDVLVANYGGGSVAALPLA